MRSSSLFEKSDFRDSTNHRATMMVSGDCVGDQVFLGHAVHWYYPVAWRANI